MALTKITLSGAIDTIRGMSNKFNDLIDDLLSTSNGLGASQVGVEDTAGNMSADNVEDALAEVYTDTSSTRTLAEIFSEAPATTTGLTWGYTGGLFRVDNSVTEVSAGTVSLTDDATNYVEIKTSDGSVTRNTTAFTSGRIPLRQIVTASGVQTTSTDKRAWFTQDAADTGATTDVAGIIEIATDAEVLAGTATDLAVVPSSLKSIRDIIPMQNLLTNSGFGVWSNSTLENVGSNLITGWTNYVSTPYDTLTLTGPDITSAIDAAASGYGYTNTVVAVPGKLYKLIATPTVNSGQNPFLLIGTGLGSTTYYGETAISAATTVVFEATSADLAVTMHSTAATNYSCTFTLYEVTPGCVAADNKGPDGWKKAGTTKPDIWREHTGDDTKEGSFYSLKFVSTETAASSHTVVWPSGYTQDTHIQSFRGRTVTVGCWVKADTAGIAKVGLYDNVTGYTKSAFNVGTGWEWLEISGVVDSGCTFFWVQLGVETTGKTVYFSQPMLVFGSSIGEGNYQPIPQEIIYLETKVELTDYNGSGTQDTTGITLNLEAQSNGKIPKGLKAFKTGYFKGSCATVEKLLYFEGILNNIDLALTSSVANVWVNTSGWSSCSADGDVLFDAQDTFNEILIRIVAIQLR